MFKGASPGAEGLAKKEKGTRIGGGLPSQGIDNGGGGPTRRPSRTWLATQGGKPANSSRAKPGEVKRGKRGGIPATFGLATEFGRSGKRHKIR